MTQELLDLRLSILEGRYEDALVIVDRAFVPDVFSLSQRITRCPGSTLQAASRL